jgi:peptidoglycan/xylan/chitin deacetylase (PgdA/CDA1 family)
MRRTQLSVAVLAATLLAAPSACGRPAGGPATTTPTGSPTTSSSTGPATTTTSPSMTRTPSTTHPPATTTRRPTPSTTRAPSPTPTRTPTATPRPTTPALPPALSDGVVTRIPTTRKVVALTFDGGAGAQGAASILSTLRAQGVPASFFVTGQFATTNPALVRQMAAVGPVGNHTWDHPHLPDLSDSAVRSQLSRTSTAIRAAGAPDPRPFFRFPFGDQSAHALSVVHAAGYGAVGWTTDSLGWKGTSGGQSVDSVVRRVLAARTPGQIVLMHVGANPDDHTTLDAAALARIVAGYRAAGYGFTTLDALR